METFFVAIAWKAMWVLIAVAAAIGIAHWIDRFGGPADEGFCGEHA